MPEKPSSATLEHSPTIEEDFSKLVNTIRFRTSEGIKDVQRIEEIFDNLRAEFVTLSHTYDLSEAERNRGKDLAEILNQATTVAEQEINNP